MSQPSVSDVHHTTTDEARKADGPDFASMSHGEIADWWMDNDPVTWEEHLLDDPVSSEQVMDSFRASSRARQEAAQRSEEG